MNPTHKNPYQKQIQNSHIYKDTNFFERKSDLQLRRSDIRQRQSGSFYLLCQEQGSLPLESMEKITAHVAFFSMEKLQQASELREMVIKKLMTQVL